MCRSFSLNGDSYAFPVLSLPLRLRGSMFTWVLSFWEGAFTVVLQANIQKECDFVWVQRPALEGDVTPPSQAKIQKERDFAWV